MYGPHFRKIVSTYTVPKMDRIMSFLLEGEKKVCGITLFLSAATTMYIRM